MKTPLLWRLKAWDRRRACLQFHAPAPTDVVRMPSGKAVSETGATPVPRPALSTTLCLALLLLPALTVRAQSAIGLAGQWRFALDRGDVGASERWFARDLPDRIQLPGVLQAQGFGDEISLTTPWVLSLYDRNWFLRADYAAYTNAGQVKVPFLCQPPRHYLGAAWYQRDVEIPADWSGRRVVLFLERPRWESRVWLDDQFIGTNNSLCAPHEFEVCIVGQASRLSLDEDKNGDGRDARPTVVTTGRHRLTVRLDNRMLLPYRPDAHAVSDSLGSAWNGIVGKLELRSTPLLWIEQVQVFPEVARKAARVRVTVGNQTGKPARMELDVHPAVLNATSAPPIAVESRNFEASPQQSVVEAEINLADVCYLWDEFRPWLYRLVVRVERVDDRTVFDSADTTFGLRDFRAVGQAFTINGRPTHLRGTHHGGDFPLTGHPPCEVDYWRKLWRTCKDWGLNHVRFHSFCPPEAAFTAADAVGIYLQIEPGMWKHLQPRHADGGDAAP
jgi:beta-galactosidase